MTRDLTTEGKKVYLLYSQGGILDSAVVTQGHFRFKGKMPHGEKALLTMLRLYPNYILPLVLEPGYKLKAHMEANGAHGSPLNDELYRFMARIDSVETYYFNSLREVVSIDSFCSQKKAQLTLAIDQTYRTMHQTKLKIAKETLEQHPEDMVGLQAFRFILTEAEPHLDTEIKKLYLRLDPIIQEDSQVQYLLDLRSNR